MSEAEQAAVAEEEIEEQETPEEEVEASSEEGSEESAPEESAEPQESDWDPHDSWRQAQQRIHSRRESERMEAMRKQIEELGGQQAPQQPQEAPEGSPEDPWDRVAHIVRQEVQGIMGPHFERQQLEAQLSHEQQRRMAEIDNFRQTVGQMEAEYETHRPGYKKRLGDAVAARIEEIVEERSLDPASAHQQVQRELAFEMERSATQGRHAVADVDSWSQVVLARSQGRSKQKKARKEIAETKKQLESGTTGSISSSSKANGQGRRVTGAMLARQGKVTPKKLDEAARTRLSEFNNNHSQALSAIRREYEQAVQES